MNFRLVFKLTGKTLMVEACAMLLSLIHIFLEPDETGVSDWLNTTDHNAYMNGYDTGSFGPNDNMTRAEAAQLFYNLLLNKNVTVTVSFTDVPSDAWYSKAVNVLASLGMLNGVGGDLFEPERTITRAEFTALGMRFADLGTSGENIFSDVHPGDWFYDNVVGSIQYLSLIHIYIHSPAAARAARLNHWEADRGP